MPWLQARYRCATAELKMNEGESEAASVLMQEAFAQLERQRPPQFAAMVECLIDDAYLASLTGDSQRAIERGLQAARLHEERGLTNTNSYAEAWSGFDDGVLVCGRRAERAGRDPQGSATRMCGSARTTRSATSPRCFSKPRFSTAAAVAQKHSRGAATSGTLPGSWPP